MLEDVVARASSGQGGAAAEAPAAALAQRLLVSGDPDVK
jgi:hypothetical protein